MGDVGREVRGGGVNARAGLADGVYLYRRIYIKLCEVVGGKEDDYKNSQVRSSYMMSSATYISRGGLNENRALCSKGLSR